MFYSFKLIKINKQIYFQSYIIHGDQIKVATIGNSKVLILQQTINGEHCLIFQTHYNYVVQILKSSSYFPIWQSTLTFLMGYPSVHDIFRFDS